MGAPLLDGRRGAAAAIWHRRGGDQIKEKGGRGGGQNNLFDQIRFPPPPNNCQGNESPENAAANLKCIISAFPHKANHPR